MKLELAIHDSLTSYDDLRKAIFLASHHKFDILSVPLIYAGKIQEFSGALSFSGIVDFPQGNSPTEIRLHSILQAQRYQLHNIDLVLNNSFVINEEWGLLAKDIRACKEVCKNKNMNLRFILDYRLFPVEKILEIGALLVKNGLTEIITTTGVVQDDLVDNLIITNQLRKLGAKVILASNAITTKNYEQLSKYNLHGIRFMSTNLVKNIFGDF